VAPAHAGYAGSTACPSGFLGWVIATVACNPVMRTFGWILGLALASATAHADPKRAVPDYDGRGNVEADAETWSLWIPRVVLSPLYLTNEFLLRRPLGAFVRHAEREHWAESVISVFTFGKGGKSFIVPTALFDFGLLPSVGIYYSGGDLFAKGNTLRLHAATWGPAWVNVTASDRYQINETDRVEARGEFKRSLDNLFFGIGPDVVRSNRSRFGLERVEGSSSYRRALASTTRLDVAGGVHRYTFIEGTCCSDPSIDELLAAGAVDKPPGYRDTYTTAFARAGLTLDTRRPKPAPGSGVYTNVHGAGNFDLYRSRSWLQYGAAVGAALDLTGHQRTLRVQLAADFVDPMQGSGGDIPFIELVSLGGELMPGFVAGWMTGRSTIAAQLGYTWPIWMALDGQLRFTAGNAFGERLEGLEAKKLRLSGDIGIATSAARDQSFEVLFGLGTETFEQGGGITSVRVTFGSRRGF
jgi:hypothetical protein